MSLKVYIPVMKASVKFLASCHTPTDPNHIFAKLRITTSYHKTLLKTAVTQQWQKLRWKLWPIACI